MELVCLENTRRLTLSEWQRLEEGYLCYRAAANHLCHLAIANGTPRWHVRPKCHYLEHAVYDFGMKNLRHMSNYLDEDMIRRVKRMAVAAHPRYVSQHVVYRYALAACLRWTGMIRWKNKPDRSLCGLAVRKLWFCRFLFLYTYLSGMPPWSKPFRITGMRVLKREQFRDGHGHVDSNKSSKGGW